MDIVSILLLAVPVVVGILGALSLGRYRKYAFIALAAEKAFWAVEEAADGKLESAAKLAEGLKLISAAVGRALTRDEIKEAQKVLAKKAKKAKPLKHPLQKK